MANEQVERYYREAFAEVNGKGVGGWATRFFHKAIEKDFDRSSGFSRVLELGAAHGEHVKWVRHSFNRYFLTDIIDRKIDLERLTSILIAEKGERKLEFHLADAEHLPFDSESFDRTVHTCLLHHLANPEAAMREMRRVSVAGGTVSIYLPNDPGLMYRATQRTTTGRAQKKLLRREKYDISAGYLRSLEHPNHYLALRELIREVFRDDDVQAHYFPFGIDLYDLNYFSVFHITIRK